MGWSFLPLVQVYGTGTDASTIEPLHEHLDVYEANWPRTSPRASRATIAACGCTTPTRRRRWSKSGSTSTKNTAPILDSDIIHVRRPDGRDIDCMLHVNPSLKQKGLAVVFNPLERPVTTTLTLSLYYTGLTESATIRREEGEPATYRLDRQHNVEVPIEMASRSVTWFVIECDFPSRRHANKFCGSCRNWSWYIVLRRTAVRVPMDCSHPQRTTCFPDNHWVNGIDDRRGDGKPFQVGQDARKPDHRSDGDQPDKTTGASATTVASW